MNSTVQEITTHGLGVAMLTTRVVANCGEDTYSSLVSSCSSSCLLEFTPTIQWRELRDSWTASLGDSSNVQRIMNNLSSTGNVRNLTSSDGFGYLTLMFRLSDHNLRRAVFSPGLWNYAKRLVLSR